MGGVNTILQANNTTRVARAQYRSNVAQTRNTNRLQSSGAEFADFMRTFKNKEAVTAAGKEYNFRMDQLSDELRAAGGANMNSQVELAAARGALAAQAGAVGVGGSSADLMDTMVRLQSEMDQETANNARDLLASRGASQAAQIVAGAYKGQDLSRTFGSYDYRQYIEPVAMKRRLGKLVGVAVATYFGGPMAGEAVADFAVGEWQASNGDFHGAGANFADAAGNAMGAFQQSAQRGQAWGSAVAEGMGWKDGKAAGVNSSAKVTTTGAFNKDSPTGKLGWF